MVERQPSPSYILSVAQAGQTSTLHSGDPSACSHKTVTGSTEQNVVWGEDFPGISPEFSV